LPPGLLRKVSKYIEVKTTRGPAETPFYMSANEVEFSRTHPDKSNAVCWCSSTGTAR
jgi:hypothetical protein